LADDVVRCLQILKRAIPGLDLLLDGRYFDGNDRLKGAIWEPDRDGRKVGFGELPEPEPVAFEQSATSG
jgi:hypothetical protein